MSLLKRQLAAGNPAVKSEILNLESFLKQLFDRQLEGSKIRSRVEWLEEGETPSKYFLCLENERYAKSFVSSVYNSAGVEVSFLPEMIAAHTAFYTDLFSRGNIDLKSQQELFSHVTSCLSEAESSSCEGPLILAEVSEALRRSNRNKSLGADGLTVEFYAHFWEKLGSILVDVFNQGLARGELPDSMKASVTRLIHKKDDKRNLKNWRPILLLNVHYKICSKAVSIHLAGVIGSIVDLDQTCSIPGRSIYPNLALLRDTLAFIERTGESGILLSLDQDCVDRSFLIDLLELFGFGPWFRTTIATLYNGVYMQVLVNDFFIRLNPVRKGCQTGRCSVSNVICTMRGGLSL